MLKNHPRVFGNKIVTPRKINWDASLGIRNELYKAVKIKGRKEVTLDLSDAIAIYPNGIIPIIAQIDHLRRQDAFIRVILPTDANLRRVCAAYGWAHYLSPDKFSLSTRGHENFSPLAAFRSDTELNDQVNRVLDVCYQQLVFACGVPQAFEWAINEIAGNVLVHSGDNFGWIQVITYKESHKLSLLVCDSGVGIPSAMRARYKVQSDKEAVELAMQKGTTSRPDFGQGNGLAGSLAIAKQTGGQFTVTSGRGQFHLMNNHISARESAFYMKGAIVQLQLPTNVPIDLPKALWGHNPVDYVELKFTNDDGEIVFNPRHFASSFGNRITGEKLRIVVINLIRQNPGKTLLIKMDGISVISSSFADELFGKLFWEIGAIDFSSLVRFSGLNPLCKGIINQAIVERVADNELHKKGLV